jgi:Destabilase
MVDQLFANFQVESNCNPNIGCRMDVGSLSCGAYQIKEGYWRDCGSPGGGLFCFVAT